MALKRLIPQVMLTLLSLVMMLGLLATSKLWPMNSMEPGVTNINLG
jgi:hypothetical protein